MDVKEIIMHLQNFQTTWKSWDKLITGVTSFFAQNPINELKTYFDRDASPLNALSSTK